MDEIRFHEIANIFPLLEGDSLQSLSESIKKNGLLEPIELFEGKILDGRNRKIACLLAGVEPRFVDVNPSDPIAYVLAKNRDRRHLTPSLWAMIAARAREAYDKQAKERQKRKAADSVQENLPEQKGQARGQAGKALGVSGRTVDFATKVLKQGTPELVKAVDEGRMAVSTAAIRRAKRPETNRVRKTYLTRSTPAKLVTTPAKPWASPAGQWSLS